MRLFSEIFILHLHNRQPRSGTSLFFAKDENVDVLQCNLLERFKDSFREWDTVPYSRYKISVAVQKAYAEFIVFKIERDSLVAKR